MLDNNYKDVITLLESNNYDITSKLNDKIIVNLAKEDRPESAWILYFNTSNTCIRIDALVAPNLSKTYWSGILKYNITSYDGKNMYYGKYMNKHFSVFMRLTSNVHYFIYASAK
jgi:hypothetical protein